MIYYLLTTWLLSVLIYILGVIWIVATFYVITRVGTEDTTGFDLFDRINSYLRNKLKKT